MAGSDSAGSDSAGSGLSAPSVGWWTKAHGGLLLAALAVLIVAGRGQHFFYDEWAFLGGKLDALPFPDRYLLPHNEHWTLLPLVTYRILRATVGVGSYWPYLGLLLMLHLGVTHILWRLMVVLGSRPIVATSGAAVFGVLGAAAEDLVWAFQIAFVGSTLLGTGAIYLAVTGTASWRKTAVLTCLTLAGLATSGVGVAYLIVVPLAYAWRQRRHAFIVLCLPLLVYLTWYLTYGRSLTHPPRDWVTVPLLIAAFVAIGLATASTGYFGLGTSSALTALLLGVPIVAGLLLACRDWIGDKTLAGRTASAMCVGAAAFFGAAGLARGGLGLGMATSPRYAYVAIALLLPGLALVISRGAARHPALIKAIVPVAFAMAVGNIIQLMAYAAETRQNSTASLRVLTAASELVSRNTALFSDQLPEPALAPDLTATDLRSRRLDVAFQDGIPAPRDHLTASLNLQIKIALHRVTGTTPTCSSSPARQITVPVSRHTAPKFTVTADSPVAFTLNDAGLRSGQRVIMLTKGTYIIHSRRMGGELTLDSSSPSSLMGNC